MMIGGLTQAPGWSIMSINWEGFQPGRGARRRSIMRISCEGLSQAPRHQEHQTQQAEGPETLESLNYTPLRTLIKTNMFNTLLGCKEQEQNMIPKGDLVKALPSAAG